MQPASIVAEAGRLWWKCPCCGRTLAELKDGRVVIKAGDRLLVATVTETMAQKCPARGCWEWSEYRSPSKAQVA